MKTHLATLLLILLIKISIVNAIRSSLHENLSLPQPTFNASIDLVDIHYLECQLKISQEFQRFEELQTRAHSISDSFNKVLKVTNKNTLDICTQVHKDLIDPEQPTHRAQLSDWIPTFLRSPVERFMSSKQIQSPTERFLSSGQTFLATLSSVRLRAWWLAYIIEHDISDFVMTLNAHCQGTLAPCTEASHLRIQSSLELRACSKINALEDFTQTAKTWKAMALDIQEIRDILGSTRNLVKKAQEGNQKATEEWTANVVAKWIIVLEDLVVRTEGSKQ